MSVDPLGAFSPATRAWFHSTFAEPTRVQREGWPHLVAGRNALLLAPTGSGKTLAAFLTALDRLTLLPADAAPGVRVVYVSPLKALVHDIERNLRAPLVGIGNAAAAAGSSLRAVGVDLRTGDTSARDRRRQRKAPGEILVTTPESLYLLLGSEARETLRTVESVIVDEIHVLAGSKRGVHLALSLERLAQLTERDPQRIGLSATQRPLERIARFLGGDREVEIVDTSEPPHIALTIRVPVEDMDRPVSPATPLNGGGEGQRQRVGTAPGPSLDAAAAELDEDEDEDPSFGGLSTPARPSPQRGMWPVLYPEILALIRAHRATIVFTNSRLLCERLAARLNELAGEELVRAHHGSIAHAQREQIEEQLKAGELPAIVATSSLELGIDMGAVDLVVLVESPGSVASGLQRIGRAGHGVGQLSAGTLFPKYKADLVECAVVAERMQRGAIEQTHVPHRCLDVLAQQIVAMVAMDDWQVDALAAVVRRASPYADLSDAQLVGVLDMLSGRYPSDAFADLSPRLNWDRATDALTARRGARKLAVLNGGTIPDRGLYTVFLANADGPRLGELDEEMVYESRPGDTILLGASTWRIEEITRDRVFVTPAPGQPGRLPFWRGDRPGRPADLGAAIGALVRQVAALPDDEAAASLPTTAQLDDNARTNLIAYVREQADATGEVPSDRTLVLERFRDELGDWRICLLSPFGSRIHAPWAMAIEAVLSTQAGFDVQTLWTDDGLSLRFADTDELPPLDALFPSPDAVEQLVVEQLGSSALFAARFRENAARAMLLPRRSFKGRTPLWQQRLKAQRLQAAATQHAAFPIVLETYRECLADVFDLPGLRALLQRIERREVVIHEVETRSPSPFARSIVFAWVAAYMYDGDAPLAERRAQALTLDRELLRDLLGQEELRELLEPAAVDEVEAELQWLTPERRARHADALHDLLRRLGDLSEAELAARCDGDLRGWLDTLARSRRAVAVRVGGEARWIAAEDAARYRDALGTALPPGLARALLEPSPDPLESLLARWARTHGPFVAGPIAARWALPIGAVSAGLRSLERTNRLIRGGLRPGGAGEEWCDPDVMRRLRRRSLAKLRDEVAPVEADVYARFLIGWHGVGSERAGDARLQEVIDQLEGAALPYSALETELLPQRVRGYSPTMLDQLGMTGQLCWIGRGALGSRDGRVALYWRDTVGLLVDPPAPAEGLLDEEPVRRALLEHLQQRGASFLVELHAASGGARPEEVERALWDLVWAGLVTNDTFLPLRSLGGRAPARAGRRASARGRSRAAGGRWSAVTSLLGPPATATEAAHARASLLLERYGVASSKAAQAEEIGGGFSALYPVYQAMEEAGRARRGWFIDALGGAQFALPGAVDRLRACRPPQRAATVLAATDPANPWGALVPWPDRPDPQPRREAGALVALVDGAPVLYFARGGRRALTFGDLDALPAVVSVLSSHPRRRELRIEQIDDDDVTSSPLREVFLQAGFCADYKRLELP